jgi:hypothetical protein
MGSEFEDWIYWHFFTITMNYNSSQSMNVYDSLHSLLDHERILFHCDEWRRTNHCSHIELPSDFWITTPVWRMLSRLNSAERSHVFSLHSFVRTKERWQFPTVHVTACLSVSAGPCVNSVATLLFHYSCFQAVFSEPLPSTLLYSSKYRVSIDCWCRWPRAILFWWFVIFDVVVGSVFAFFFFVLY